MIPDVDESLRQLLIQKGGIAPSVVDIRFEPPARERSQPKDSLAIHLYLYDVRENVEQREVYWDTVKEGDARVRMTRRPLRIDLSYLITCHAAAVEDEHHLLWQVLETLYRHSPLPDDVLRGEMQHLLRPAQTRIAQPDGLIKSPAEVWGTLGVGFPPSVHLVVTVELDLNQVRTTPLVFTRTLKVGRRRVSQGTDGHGIPLDELEQEWEAAPAELGGIVHSVGGQPVSGVAVRLLSQAADGAPVQMGPSRLTDTAGHYRFPSVPPGEYNLVVEAPGQKPLQRPLCVSVGERGESLPDFVYDVEIPGPETPAPDKRRAVAKGES